MRIRVVTLFPEMFSTPLSLGLVGRALAAKSATVELIDPRVFTHDRHHSVDDTPYGGGAGMVLKLEPIAAAIRAARGERTDPRPRVLLLTPQGRPLLQRDLVRYSTLPELVLVAGRYEGFDERIRSMVDEEISLGDFVLTGGEVVALAIIDGVVRLLPGTLGNADSPLSDSFADGLLEHPQYTRPEELDGLSVPEMLLSGHHANIARWRRARSLERTKLRRPDLLAECPLSAEDIQVLRDAPSARPRFELGLAAGTFRTPKGREMMTELARGYGAERLVFIGEEPAAPTVSAWIAGAEAKYTRCERLGIPIEAVGPPTGNPIEAHHPPGGGFTGAAAVFGRAKESGAAILLFACARSDPSWDVMGPGTTWLYPPRRGNDFNEFSPELRVAIALDRLFHDG